MESVWGVWEDDSREAGVGEVAEGDVGGGAEVAADEAADEAADAAAIGVAEERLAAEAIEEEGSETDMEAI